MTDARFRIGLFESESMGRLMARQIVSEMTEAGVFLRTNSRRKTVKATEPYLRIG